ncbi:zinc-binding dehydrogenase [Dactylosporangium fulvum]|uniref:Zinc-binding dehydrogenase n=1 Tax=Dactylosporangium fulvum TaxID=53359 RepID=A0ABY5WBA8_9ACTN|nr:zinc-binding dehydrogenase [Dactylosporangium fulvum]UWP87152.1 zinc-binding dehydrogenase [Dactylosporangium fulvum]
MQAIIAGPGGPALGTAPEPDPAPDQVVVAVRHASVNYGEARYAAAWPAGTVLGYDAAGVVVRAARDGSGPGEGQRVAAFGAGAWAERAAFGTDSVAVVPDGVDLATAAALPLAGITALRTVRAAGSIVGRRVLVTGASGGVGRLAVQLARLGGAHVVAAAGRTDGLTGLGAHEVVTALDQVGEAVDVVLEHVGGRHLIDAWALLRPGGVLQSIGWASDAPAVFPPNSIFAHGPAKTLMSFGDASRPAADLTTLLGLVAAGHLRVDVGWRGPWDTVTAAVDALLARRVPGKAVLDIS